MSEAIRETILTSEGHKYRGELRTFVGVAGLVCDGHGTMNYTTGDVYEGQWKVNKRHGNGSMQYADGGLYDGEWEDDFRHGCGSMTYPTGDQYEGAFVKDVSHGIGSQTLASGERYTGGFVKGKRQGRGIVDLVDGSTYEGTFSEGFMHGYGTLRLANGDTFEGSFVRSAMHGKGRYTFLSGDFFDGEYENGIRVAGVLSRQGTDGKEFDATFTTEGVLSHLKEKQSGTAINFDASVVGRVEQQQSWSDGEGTIVLPSGETYTGSIRNGARNGAGKLTTTNGDVFEGVWVDNELEGEGKMVLDKARQLGPSHFGWRYVGGFHCGRFHGYGRLTYDTDGGEYVGHWVEGLREGLGQEKCMGESYEGDFQSDVRHGNGTLRTNEATYCGRFVAGVLRDPEGKVTYSDGATYFGSLADRLREGEGRLIYANGDVYDGEFANNMRNGAGVLTQTNGDVYQGQWKDDQMHGCGLLTFDDHSTYEGRFANNRKHGQGVLTDSRTGKKFTVVYRDDVIRERHEIEE